MRSARVILLADSEVQACVDALLRASGTPFQVDHALEPPSREVILEADIVISEILLFGASPLAAISELAGIAEERPVVVVSKLNDEQIAREAILRGIQDYLPLEQVDHRQLCRALLYAQVRHRANRRPDAREETCLPTWDPERRELRVGSIVAKRFSKPSPNQELILASFQEQGWPRRVMDPLRVHPDIEPKERLRATVRSLNQRHEQLILRFHGDGSGEAICWELHHSRPLGRR